MASPSSQLERAAEGEDDTVDNSNMNSKNGEESKVASGAEDVEENATKEVVSDKNGEDANNEIVTQEEMDVVTAQEEDGNSEQNAIEDDNELDASGEEEDDEEEEVTEGEEEEEEGEEEDEEEEEAGKEVNEEENEKKVTEQPKAENAVGANSKEKGKKRIRKKKSVLTGSGTVTTEGEDKPESSRKKKVPKRAESMGMIFMCSSKTKKDCFRYNVLGLPATKRDLVLKIYRGMRLFLFDLDLRLMYGIYKAAGPGGYNIEPKAFKSAFPSQVRFTVMEDCLPLGEEKFRAVIKNNYFTKNKFDCQLTAEQVKNLCKLFSASSKGSKSKQVPRSVGAGARRRIEGDRTRPRPRHADRDEPRHRPVARDETRPRPKPRRERPEGRRPAALVDRHRRARHRDRPMYEREALRSPPPPVHHYQPLPHPSYSSYGRAPDIDAYGRDPIVDHRYLDEVGGGRDYYVSYRDPPPPVYREALYPPVVEHSSLSEVRPGYRLVAAPPADYRLSAAAPPPEYDPHRVLYRY